jgi:hypothetical protein
MHMLIYVGFLLFVYICIVVTNIIIREGELKLNKLLFCSCPKPGPGFPTSYVVVLLCVQWFEMRGVLLMIVELLTTEKIFVSSVISLISAIFLWKIFPKLAGHWSEQDKNGAFQRRSRFSVILFSNQNHPCGHHCLNFLFIFIFFVIYKFYEQFSYRIVNCMILACIDFSFSLYKHVSLVT